MMELLMTYAEQMKIRLTEDELELAQKHFSYLLLGFDELTKIDTSSTLPLVSTSQTFNVTREDKVIRTIDANDILAFAHTDNKKYFEIPGILQ